MPSASEEVYLTGPPQGGCKTPDGSNLFPLSCHSAVYYAYPGLYVGTFILQTAQEKWLLLETSCEETETHLFCLFLGNDFSFIMCILSENLQLP